jgi:hypothetical protein
LSSYGSASTLTEPGDRGPLIEYIKCFMRDYSRWARQSHSNAVLMDVVRLLAFG